MTANTISDAVTMTGGEGTLLANRYRIVRQLGQGGMGSVWLAEDTQLDNKPFAIKMLPSILVSNKRAYRQLKDEALVAMRLVHPNIVQIRAFEENNGNPFLVMDYIDGQTLDDYLAEKGKFSEEETIRLLKPIAAALDYAHGEGVVHRDVKPANVMIRKDGHPFILDFGIAREIQETMTRVTGKLSSGTLLYMSPEQLNGEPPKSAQDVYSFAAMVYECLKGEPPFSRGQIEHQILNNMPPPLAGTSVSLSCSIMSGLAKKPEDRPPTCAAVLNGKVSRKAAEALSSSEWNPDSPQCVGPHFVAAMKAVIAVALLAAFAAGAWWWTENEKVTEGRSVTTRTTDTPPVPPTLPPTPTPQPTNDTAAAEVQAIELAVEAGVIKGRVDLAAKQFNLAVTEASKERDRQIAEQREEETKANAELERRAKWRKEGEQFTIDEPYGLNMTMNWCPPGTFTMGSPISEEGRSDNERQHEVSLTKGFWMGETEVTQGQWKILMDGETIVDLMRKGLRDDTVYTFGNKRLTLREYWGNWSDKYGDIKDDMPVYYVSWNDAVEFCHRLTQLEHGAGRIPNGYEYRLPTEAEWEYACRAGSTAALPNGRNIRILGKYNAPALDDIAWYGGNSSVGFDGRGIQTANWSEKQYPGGRAYPREVKGKRANNWGFYDMVGNVSEWCNDWYSHNLDHLTIDPIGVVSGEYRVLRGGSWAFNASLCRSAFRYRDSPGMRSNILGFRVALAPCVNAKEGDDGEGKIETSHTSLPFHGNTLILNEKLSRFQTGDTKTLTLPGGATIDMIYVAPGSFMMGSPASEEGRKNNEAQHRVTLTKGYWLGKYEVTQKQWQSVMGEIPSYAELPLDYKGDQYPVIKVSWNDCQMFVRRVNLELNCGARLPTEAEWEYACRAGSTTAYHWGGVLNGEKANCNGNFPYGTAIKGPYLQKPTPVGHYAANQWGFYDMHGNVNEWCDDWYDKNYYAYSPANDPHGPASGQYRVSRGGSMNFNANNCRSAFRIMNPPELRAGGFRLCCDSMLNE